MALALVEDGEFCPVETPCQTRGAGEAGSACAGNDDAGKFSLQGLLQRELGAMQSERRRR
jgi:hypothetical protein